MKRQRFVRSRDAAAAELGVESSRLSRWKAAGWFPAGGHITGKGWNVELIRQARDAMGLRGSPESDARRAIHLATMAEKLKQSRIATQMKEIDLRVQLGELLQRDGIELFLATFLTGVGDDLDQLPTIAGQAISAPVRKRATKLFRDELDRFRLRLRDRLERDATDRNHEQVDPAAVGD